jgi:formamidopyrimidine-DNA glycosylase
MRQDGSVPELPEVDAIATFLDERMIGNILARVDLTSISALKTFDPALEALTGRVVVGVRRRGKYLIIDASRADDRLFLVTHLARAGWVQWRDDVPTGRPKPGKGPLALRIQLVNTDGEPVGGIDLTEAGTRKGLAVWVVRDVDSIAAVASLGPEPLAPDFTVERLQQILNAAGGHQIKGVLRDQSLIAGIGNAYSDEVLHVVGLSPFAACSKLSSQQVADLHRAIQETLTDAIARSVGQQPALLKSEKRAGMRVHGRTGEACPVCADVIREVSFADRSLQYCPTCQTGGKPLADRRMSRLIK